MLNIRKNVVIGLLACCSGAALANDAMWLGAGVGAYGSGAAGGSLMFTYMGNEWGGSVRRTVVVENGFGCAITTLYSNLINGLSPDCNETMEEVAVMLNRSFYSGRMIAGIGLGQVAFVNSVAPAKDEDLLAIPVSLTWRTRRAAHFGAGFSLLGNINERESFIGLNVQMEAGRRY